MTSLRSAAMRRPLALRLYALTAAISIATMVALFVLPRFVGSPRYLEPQAALVRRRVRPPRDLGRPRGRDRPQDEIVPGVGRAVGALHEQRGGEQAAELRVPQAVSPARVTAAFHPR